MTDQYEITRDQAKLKDLKNGGDKVASIVNQAVDDATQQIVGQLDGLIKEIEALKGRVIQNSGAAKAKISEHFNLGAAALHQADAIRDTLAKIESGVDAVKVQ